MTVQEAIKCFEETIDVYEIFPIINDDKLAATKIAVDALKKQIPMEAILVNGRFECPSCHSNKRALGFYCDECGQKLDWGVADAWCIY